MELSSNRKSIFFLLLFSIAVLVFSFYFLIHKATKDARVHFLSAKNGAEWIMYPLELSTSSRRNKYNTLIADFSHSFSLKQIPPDVSVNIRAFQEFDLFINGKQVPNPPIGDLNWKSIKKLSVSTYLFSGINKVSIKVKANYGPPSLWLRFSGLSEKISTDDKWLVSINDVPPLHAIRADDTRLHGFSYKFPKPIDSLKHTYPQLISFFLIGVIFYIVLFLKKPQYIKTINAWIKQNILTPNIALLVVALFWTVLFINNVKQLSIKMGFDATSHIEYLMYLINNKALPLASDLFQGYQPPLFYFINALIVPLAEKILSFPSLNYAYKITSFLSGFGQVIIAFFAGRIVFRKDKICHSLLIVISGLIPMNIYISHYFSNESFSAFWISLSILMTLVILDSPKPLYRHFVILGLSIALALLTKVTALVILPIIFFSVFFHSILIIKNRISTSFLHVLIAFLIIVGLSGWFYLRNYLSFGKPLIANWDHLLGFNWWQDPGFHTASFFTSFGNVFSYPFLSSFYSFWDSIYATFWGDSLIGGKSVYWMAPPWNYEYMAVVYLISIPATLFFIIGILRAIYKIIFHMDFMWLLCVGSIFLFGFNLVYINIAHPFYSAAKAFYALGALLPVTLLFTYGVSTLRIFKGKLKIVLCCIIGGWLVTLAISIFLSYLITPHQKQIYNDIENKNDPLKTAIYHMNQGDFKAAAPYFKEAIELNPNSVMSRALYARALFGKGLMNDAIMNMRQAIQIDPYNSSAHFDLALMLIENKQYKQANYHLQKAILIDPFNDGAKQILNWLISQQR